MKSQRSPGRGTRALALATCAVAGLALGACASPPAGDPLARASRRAAHEHSMRTATVERSPASFQEALRAGDRFRDAGDLSRAIWNYVRALDLDPDSTVARERIAYVHLREDPERAAVIFREVLEEHPDAVPARIGLGLALVAQGDLPGARHELEGALVLDPDAPVALTALGVVYDRMGDCARARETLRRALARRPRDPRIHNNLGVSHLLAGEPREAEAAFRQALEHAPQDALLWNNLGLALGMQERYDEALQAFRQAGSEQAAHNNLGYVAALNGDRERALAHYEHALLVGGPDTERVVENLRALRADEESGRLTIRRLHHEEVLARMAAPEPAEATAVAEVVDGAASREPGPFVAPPVPFATSGGPSPDDTPETAASAPAAEPPAAPVAMSATAQPLAPSADPEPAETAGEPTLAGDADMAEAAPGAETHALQGAPASEPAPLARVEPTPTADAAPVQAAVSEAGSGASAPAEAAATPEPAATADPPAPLVGEADLLEARLPSAAAGAGEPAEGIDVGPVDEAAPVEAPVAPGLLAEVIEEPVLVAPEASGAHSPAADAPPAPASEDREPAFAPLPGSLEMLLPPRDAEAASAEPGTLRSAGEPGARTPVDADDDAEPAPRSDGAQPAASAAPDPAVAEVRL